MGVFAPEWKGNFMNSNINGLSNSFGIVANKWVGKISGSKIVLTGANFIRLTTNSSKGTISKITIHVKKGRPVKVSKEAKISGSSIISKKGELVFIILVQE